MKRFKMVKLAFICMLMAISFVACDKDDDKNVTEGNDEIAGVWKEAGYDFYWYLETGGSAVVIEVYDGQVWKEYLTWRKSGNKILMDGDPWNIEELTETTLKVSCEGEVIKFNRSSLSAIEKYL